MTHAHIIPTDQWSHLTTSAVVVGCERAVGVLRGPKVTEALNGLVTADVALLEPGSATYAAALTPRGKLLADLFILKRADDYLIDVSPRAATAWWAMLRKYVNPKLATAIDQTAVTSVVRMVGRRARDVLSRALSGEAISRLAPHHHAVAQVGQYEITALNLPAGGYEGFTLYLPAAALTEVTTLLVRSGAAHGAVEVLDILRVHEGRPSWGTDMDDSNLLQEARLEELGAVSFTKGCYTGQEVVARVHFRGHVNKLLRGLRLPATPTPPTGATVATHDGAVVGDVRSVVYSPELGQIALAMIRREVQAESTVTITWADAKGHSTATVAELPFAAGSEATR